MKRLLLFVLTAFWALAGFQSLSQTNFTKKYSDAQQHQAYGHVKSIIEDGSTYQYDIEGALEHIIIEGKKTPFSVTHDVLGRMVSLVTFTNELPIDTLRVVKIKYDRNNRISSDETLMKQLLGGELFVSTYFYDNNGMCVEMQNSTSSPIFPEKNTKKFVYDSIKVDSHGNWIYRESSLVADDGKKTPWRINKRTITYWDNATGNGDGVNPSNRFNKNVPAETKSAATTKPQPKSTTANRPASQPKTSTSGILSSNKKMGKKSAFFVIDLVEKKCGLYDKNITWSEAEKNLKASSYNASIDKSGIDFTCPFSYNSVVPTCHVMENFKNTTFHFTINGNDAIRDIARKLTDDLKSAGVNFDYTIDTPEKAFRSYGNYRQKIISITTNKTGVLVDIF